MQDEGWSEPTAEVPMRHHSSFSMVKHSTPPLLESCWWLSSKSSTQQDVWKNIPSLFRSTALLLLCWKNPPGKFHAKMALKALAWDFLGLRREDAKQDKKAREGQQQGAVKRYCAPPLGHDLGSKGWNGCEGCNNRRYWADRWFKNCWKRITSQNVWGELL